MEAAAQTMSYLSPPAVVIAAETAQQETETQKTVTSYKRGYRGALIATIAEEQCENGYLKRVTTKYLPDGRIASVRTEYSRRCRGAMLYAFREVSDVYIEDEISGTIVSYPDGTSKGTTTTRYRSTYAPHTGSHMTIMRNGVAVMEAGTIDDTHIREATPSHVVEELKRRWLEDRDAGRVPNELPSR